MAKWVLWGLAAVVAGILLGVLGALVRRRPVPETTSYVPPEPAAGPTAVGPHRRVIRVAEPG